VQLLQFAADILAQQIVQFAHGHHHSGMAQARRAPEFAHIDLAGLRGLSRSGGLSRPWFPAH
jgi:hypothetical protein